MGAKVVPDSVPEFKDYEITQLHKPFNDIPGGDFIDYVKINDDIMVVVLGDVMGKNGVHGILQLPMLVTLEVQSALY